MYAFLDLAAADIAAVTGETPATVLDRLANPPAATPAPWEPTLAELAAADRAHFDNWPHNTRPDA